MTINEKVSFIWQISIKRGLQSVFLVHFFAYLLRIFYRLDTYITF